MKGQLTLEYLILALVSLSLISISLAALLSAREAADRAYHLELFRSSALDIYNAGEELCAMGSGNSMKIRLRENVSVSQEGDEAAFSNSLLNISISKPALCEYLPAFAEAGEASVMNEKGRIKIGR